MLLPLQLGYLWVLGGGVDKDMWIHAHKALSPAHIGHGTCVCCVSVTHMPTPLLLGRHPWGVVNVTRGTVTLDVHSEW